MSIQRWDFDFNDLDWRKDDDGPWVKIDKAVEWKDAAVAAARGEMADECEHHNHEAFTLGKATARAEMAEPLDHLITFAEGAQSTAYAAGFTAALGKARAGIVELIEVRQHGGLKPALLVIDALIKEASDE